MIIRMFLICAVLFVACLPFSGDAFDTDAEPDTYRPGEWTYNGVVSTDSVLKYVRYNDPAIAFQNVTVIDGTGAPPGAAQTILVKNGRFESIGSDGEITIPEGAVVLNLDGKTMIPGLVGMHNHLHIPGFPDVGEMASKLYLAAGVTTIQTCGATDPDTELWLAREIERSKKIGPEIIPSAPFVTGPGGNPNMIVPRDRRHLQDTLGYWINRGTKWIKVYRNVAPDDLEMIIDMAHEKGVRVRGHLCSVTFEEAAAMGIDGIEHGLNSASDFRTNKAYGNCGGGRDYMDQLKIGDRKVRALQQKMIDQGVFLTSTLAIYEASVPNRIYLERRARPVMSPYLIGQYNERMAASEKNREDRTREQRLQRIMAFERQYFKMGGLLCSGVDAGRHVLPGFGDQRNYELLIEAGFSAQEAVQVLTGNGAKALGRSDIGTIEEGRRGDFVILDGRLEMDPAAIKRVETVFKEGIGYDPGRILEPLQGQFAN